MTTRTGEANEHARRAHQGPGPVGRGRGRRDAVALQTLMTEDFTGVGPLGFSLSRQDWLDPP